MTIKQELDKWQEQYLSRFCIDYCVDSCCTRPMNYIILDEDQVREASEIPKNKLIPIKIGCTIDGVAKDGTVYYRISTCPTEEQPHCLAYNPKTRLCKIQHNKPKICEDFPLKIEKNLIRIISECEVSKTENFAFQKLKEICRSNGYSLYIKDKKENLDFSSYNSNKILYVFSINSLKFKFKKIKKY